MTDATHFFTFGEANRSERALQADLLVPALAARDSRRHLLSLIQTGEAPSIEPQEADQATVWHFVWVLRDSFTAERNAVQPTHAWQQLRRRWINLLSLPDWADDHVWWRHPEGAFAGDADFVVHPCHRSIGWTAASLELRASRFTRALSSEMKSTLVSARRVMNTECDCLIQTPKRLIVVECKDKTEFVPEQAARQRGLFVVLERLIERPLPLVFVELAGGKPAARRNQPWTWDLVRASLQSRVASN